jgi:hypothetical protein
MHSAGPRRALKPFLNSDKVRFEVVDGPVCGDEASARGSAIHTGDACTASGPCFGLQEVTCYANPGNCCCQARTTASNAPAQLRYSAALHVLQRNHEVQGLPYEPKQPYRTAWRWFEVRVDAEHAGLTVAHDRDPPCAVLTAAECLATRPCGERLRQQESAG